MRQPKSVCKNSRRGQNQDGLVAVPQAPSRVLKRAVSYLERVKRTFAERPEVYRTFLAVMHAFKEQRLDITGLVTQVYQLFEGHPSLLVGFNTFLPIGHTPMKADNNNNNVVANVDAPALNVPPPAAQQAVVVSSGW
jgi:histone deacetylase complex regulatory component SIN3